jgi:hypothetical protein
MRHRQEPRMIEVARRRQETEAAVFGQHRIEKRGQRVFILGKGLPHGKGDAMASDDRGSPRQSGQGGCGIGSHGGISCRPDWMGVPYPQATPHTLTLRKATFAKHAVLLAFYRGTA